MKSKITAILWSIIILLVAASCDSFLDITPTGMVIPKTGEEFRNLITDAYNSIPSDRGLTCLRSDELQMPTGNDKTEAINTYLDIWNWNDDEADEATASFNWRLYYHVLYIANYIIEHQAEITDISNAELKQLLGEAYMLRAYMHFTLVNLFAEPYTHCTPATTRGIPLKLSSNVNETLSVNTLQEVYDQVLADIDAASILLKIEQWDEGKTYRFNKLSANCLRARTLLYMGRYSEALDESEVIVDAHPAIENMSGSVLPNNYLSAEAIASTELILTSGYAKDFWVNSDFVKLYRAGDYRKTKYFKAETGSAYSLLKAGKSDNISPEAHRCTFRSSEFYLTAAECAMRTGDRQKALDYYLPLMRMRYPSNICNIYIAEIQALDDDALLNELLTERARELAFEGHRWFDLRRTTQPELTKTFRGITYTLLQGDPRYTLRIPSEAISANPGLAE